MESIYGPIRDVQISADTDLLCESVRHLAKYQSPEISHTSQLYYLHVYDSDTTIIGGTALLHSSLYILSPKYEKTGKVADLAGIAHDLCNQLFAIFYFR